MNFSHQHIFRKTILFLVLAELLSLFGFLLPEFRAWAFWIIVGFIFVISMIKMEYGVYTLLAELFIGSKGFLFYVDFGGTLLSIRIALWLIVMTMWLTKMVLGGWKEFPQQWKTIPARWWFGGLAFFVVVGVLVGLLNQNAQQDVFLDVNGWVFFSLLFPFFYTIRAKAQREMIITILIASATWLSAKALLLLFIYAHDPSQAAYLPLYRWVRTSGVGEITSLSPTFIRVFFQSQIFVLVAFFMLLAEYGKQSWKHWRLHVITVLCVSSIVLSFSRSFWVGAIAGLIVFLWLRKWRSLVAACIALILGVGLIAVVTYLPLPSLGGGGGGFHTLLEERVRQTDEEAISSRWNLLPELWGAIQRTPIIGAGFGTSVTYQSNDPRIVHMSATGSNDYTTYAFEWGYLDIWLKMGVFGLFVYLGLLITLGEVLYRKNHSRIAIGLLASLVALAAVHIFSPYLNHPLGIGVILLSCIFAVNADVTTMWYTHKITTSSQY